MTLKKAVEVRNIKSVYKPSQSPGQFGFGSIAANGVFITSTTWSCRESFFDRFTCVDNIRGLDRVSHKERTHMIYYTKTAKRAAFVVKFCKRVVKNWDHKPNLPYAIGNVVILDLTKFWTSSRLGFLTIFMRIAHMTKNNFLDSIEKSKYGGSTFKFAMLQFVEGYNVIDFCKDGGDIVESCNRLSIEQIKKLMVKP